MVLFSVNVLFKSLGILVIKLLHCRVSVALSIKEFGLVEISFLTHKFCVRGYMVYWVIIGVCLCVWNEYVSLNYLFVLDFSGTL